MKNAFLFIAILAVVMLIAPVMWLYNAWWFSFIWEWFAVPFGLPAYTVKQLAVGMILLSFPLGVALLNITVKVNQLKTEAIKDAVLGVSYAMLYAPLAVGVAWLFKEFFL